MGIGDSITESKASQYVEMMQDLVYNTKTQWIDPAVQRLAEYLSAERKYSPEEIAEIAGVDAESLKLILKQRPSFTTRWHQGFNILVLDDINSASIQMELVIPGEDDKTSFVSMDRPIMLKDLLAKGNMSIDDVQSLHRVHHVEPAQGTMPGLTRRLSTIAGSTFCGNGNNQNIEDAGLLDEKPSISHMLRQKPLSLGPFDVDIQFRLWGMKPLNYVSRPSQSSKMMRSQSRQSSKMTRMSSEPD